MLYTCRDVTELKQAERELAALRVELLHAARLALVGELTASIVHDIEQPLTAIVANAEAGRRLLDNPGNPCGATDLIEIFRDVLDESHVATDIVDRIRGLARKRPMERRLLDMNDVIRSVLLLVGADAARRHIQLGAELEQDCQAIEADRVSMQQVLLKSPGQCDGCYRAGQFAATTDYSPDSPRKRRHRGRRSGHRSRHSRRTVAAAV